MLLCFVITSHAYLRLIELITDETVLSLSVGVSSFLSAFPQPRVTSTMCLLAIRATESGQKASLGTAGRQCVFSALSLRDLLLQNDGRRAGVSRCGKDSDPEGS